jgi:hypothetical protein
VPKVNSSREIRGPSKPAAREQEPHMKGVGRLAREYPDAVAGLIAEHLA